MLRLYDTQRQSKEEISPLDGKTLKVYACGPTVYNYAHIGNLRTYVFEDLLLRTLQTFGTPFVHVMNITDVDDKTIKGAMAAKTTLIDFTSQYRGFWTFSCRRR